MITRNVNWRSIWFLLLLLAACFKANAITVDAGRDQHIMEKYYKVVLSGTADLGSNSISSVEWEQLTGPAVTKWISKNSLTTQFRAPEVSSDEILTFKLTVTDSTGLSASDTLNVNLNDRAELEVSIPTDGHTFPTNADLSGTAINLRDSSDNILRARARIYDVTNDLDITPWMLATYNSATKQAHFTFDSLVRDSLDPNVEYSFQFRAVDDGFGTGIGWPIGAKFFINSKPFFLNQPQESAPVNGLYTYQPVVADEDSDNFVYSISGKPTWLNFDPETGQLSGTPSSLHLGSSWSMVLSVNDGIEDSSINFNVLVTEEELPLPESDQIIDKNTNVLSGLNLNATIGVSAGHFRVNESGAATYNIPLNLPAGVAGVQPQVSLNYSSQGGDGNMGIGWSLSAGGAITRCPATIFHHGNISAVNYDENDKFCLNGQYLELENGSTYTYGADNSVYRLTNNDMSIVTAHTTTLSKGPDYFIVETKSGDTYYYGKADINSDDARVEVFNHYSGNTGVAKYWVLKYLEDIKGNRITYHYDEDVEYGSHKLSRIAYGNNVNVPASSDFAEVIFNYQENNKPRSGYVAGGPTLMDYLLDSVSINVDQQPYRFYELEYSITDTTEEKHFLETVQECLDSTKAACKEAISFGWQRPAFAHEILQSSQVCVRLNSANPDVKCENVVSNSSVNYIPFAANEIRQSGTPAGAFVSHTLDVNGDGYTDLIYANNGAWKVNFGNKNGNLGSAHSIYTLGASDSVSKYALPIDFNGDGKMELMVAANSSSNWFVLAYSSPAITYTPDELRNCLIENENQQHLCEPVDTQFAALDLGVPATGVAGNTAVMDVNGDGLQDIVYAQSSQWKVHLNNANDVPGQFSSAQNINVPSFEKISPLPSLNLDDSISLKGSSQIDFNGDGRTDILAKVTERYYECYYKPTNSSVPSDGPGECVDQQGIGWVDRVLEVDSWKVLINDSVSGNLTFSIRDHLGFVTDSARVVDFNGDGNSDIVFWHHLENDWRFALSNGYDVMSFKELDFDVSSHNKDNTYFIDINQDGRTDILHSETNGEWEIFISEAIRNSSHVVFTKRGAFNETDDDIFRFGDINGDGKLDVLTADANTNFGLRLASRPNIVDNVITEFDNGNGVKTTIEYGTLLEEGVGLSLGYSVNPADSFSPKAPMRVVKRVSSDVNEINGQLNRLAVSYGYGDYRLHREGLGSLGFGFLKTNDEQSNVVTYTNYSQDVSKPLTIGMPVSTQQLYNGELLRWSYNSLEQKAATNGGHFPYIHKSYETQFQVNSNNVHMQLDTTVTKNVYDTYGNVTKVDIELYTDAALKDDGSCNNCGTIQHNTLTTNVYEGAGGGALKGRLSRARVTKIFSDINNHLDTGNTPVHHGVADSSGARNYTVADFGYYPDGMLKDSNVNGLFTEYIYDEFGHKVEVRKFGALGANGTNVEVITSKTVYSKDGRVVQSKESATGRTTEFKYNDSSDIGVINGPVKKLKTIDYSGLETTRYLNNWGEEIVSKSPLAPAKYTTYNDCSSSCVSNAEYSITSNQEGKPTTTAYFDKFGREIATRIKHFAQNEFVYTFKTYDERGRIQREYQPTFSSTPGSYYTEYIYGESGADLDLGRLTKTKMPFKYSSNHNYNNDYQDPRVEYLGYVTNNYDGRGVLTKKEVNALGQTIRVTDAIDNDLTYVYDAAGNLEKVTKEGNGISIVQVVNKYNAFGQKIEMRDNDKGLWEYKYNAFGNVVEQINANGQPIYTEYDEYGRKVKTYGDDFTQCWVFGNDSLNTKLFDKLVSREYFDWSNATCESDIARQKIDFDFDDLGRPELTSETITGLGSLFDDIYQTFFTYDQYGRKKTQSNLSFGLTILNEYNEYGYPNKLTNYHSGRVYQEVLEMNAFGKTKEIKYANNSSEVFGFDQSSGMLISNTAYMANGSQMHAFDYKYDANSNLAYKQFAYSSYYNNASDSEDYTYDNLNRLTDRAANTGSGFTATESFGYDDFGNLKTKQGHLTYDYKDETQNGFVYKRRLKTLTDTSSNPNKSFSYDDNGNITEDGSRTFTYTSFDKPSLIKMNSSATETSFKYGLGHKRYYREDHRASSGKTTKTLYAQGHEKIVEGSNVEFKLFVGNVVITESAANSIVEESYLHKDHLGSPLSISNKSGVVIAHKAYDPWGKPRDLYTNSSVAGLAIPVTTRGYTGHEMLDELDVIHMNGRIYDPTLGRMLQADPFIQAPANTQSYNRYAYVWNNPMSYTDPSGYFVTAKSRRSMIKGLSKVFGKDLVNFAGNIAAYATGGPLGNAAWTYEFNRAMGVPPSGSLRAAAVAGASAVAFQQIGDYYESAGWKNEFWNETSIDMFKRDLTKFGSNMLTSSQIAGQIASHAMVGGVAASLNGGKFGHGFWSAGFTKGVGTSINTNAKFDVVAGTMINATIGGTASVLSGGKFANGAITGAYQSLYNEFSVKKTYKKYGSAAWRVVGGASQAVGGVVILGIGLTTSELVVGVPIAAAGGLLFFDGIDNATKGLTEIFSIYEGRSCPELVCGGLLQKGSVNLLGEEYGMAAYRVFSLATPTRVGTGVLTIDELNKAVTYANSVIVPYQALTEEKNE